MVETLQQLVEIGTFNVLQDKLDDWLDNFKYNSCDQNVATGCEIIEINAKMQGQLFKLLNLCASEGGTYGGARIIKNKLLPILGQGFFATETDSLSPRETFKQPKTYKSLNDSKRRKEFDDLYVDQTDGVRENEDLRHKLEETKIEIDRYTRQSSSEKMFDKEEILELKNQLDSIKEENEMLKVKARLTYTYKQEVDHLKEDVALLSTHRSVHGLHSPSCHSPCEICYTKPDKCHHSKCPIDSCHSHATYCDPLCLAKEQQLVSRFNDLFSTYRSEAMNILLKISDDHDNNNKIIFHSVMETFNVAKSAFRQYKSKIRNSMIGHHLGCSLEDSVQHYINGHVDDDIDVASLSHEVVRALDFKVPMIRRPPGLNFDLIGSFIRETCRIAWSMASLPVQIDVNHAVAEGELFDESRYRRSYDSDCSAAFVLHHIWPCLTKNGIVIAKGEAITMRAASNGAKIQSARSVQSPSMSISGISSPILMSPSLKSFSSRSPIAKRPF